ncbi:MAG: hypothetical protein WBO10_15540 [Pyrinomonadaceae bacterium]
MELSKTQKILLGIASGWPIVYMFLFVAFIFGMVALSSGNPGGGLETIFAGGFVILIVLHLITIFLTLGLMIFYIIHAVKNTRLDSNMRIIWILVFFFGGMLGLPVYWYLQIWKAPEPVIGQLSPAPASNWVNNEDTRRASYEPGDWR